MGKSEIRISDHLYIETIIMDLKHDRTELIAEKFVTRALNVLGIGNDTALRSMIMEDIASRQKLGPMAYEQGIAFCYPDDHVADYIAKITKPILGIGISKKGIAWLQREYKDIHNSADKIIWVNFVYFSLTPDPATHLRFIAKAASILKDKKLREILLEAKTEKEVIEIIADYEESMSAQRTSTDKNEGK